jgi:predicted ester cyclase
MPLDPDHVRDFARSYTEAWCSGDPGRVAGHFGHGGTIAVNGGPPTAAVEVARSFMATFPDLRLLMDDVVVSDDVVEFHWTCVGTDTGPGGTGSRVRFSGLEEWTFGEDGLVAESQGHFDQADYERQLGHGVEEPG